jgi:hypothetical protein
MRNRKKTQARRSKRTDVGYGRPPREHQFKPGQSGNKRGRPKGSKNEATIIGDLLDQRIAIRQNGNVKKVTLLEAIFLKAAEEAIKGNLKSAAFLLNRKLVSDSSSDHSETGTVLDIDDQKILENYAQELEERFKKARR